jgi:hypothetical protein
MDSSKRRTTAWRKVVNSGSVVIERGKSQRSPSPHSKNLFDNKSLTFYRRTIRAMFTADQINRTVDPLQLTETALPQSSPQLVGPSPFERPVRFQRNHLTIGTFTC